MEQGSQVRDKGVLTWNGSSAQKWTDQDIVQNQKDLLVF